MIIFTETMRTWDYGSHDFMGFALILIIIGRNGWIHLCIASGSFEVFGV